MNVRTALRYEPEQTRLAVVKCVKRVVDFVDAKKTLSDTDGVILTAEHIIQTFPALKLEELALVCQRMCTGYYGKFYERLKTAEFTDCIQRHEGDRAALLERLNRGEVTRGLRPGQHVKPHEIETLAQVMAKRHPLYKVGKGQKGNYLGSDEDTESQTQGTDQQPE